jgi:hypothetical protein
MNPGSLHACWDAPRFPADMAAARACMRDALAANDGRGGDIVEGFAPRVLAEVGAHGMAATASWQRIQRSALAAKLFATFHFDLLNALMHPSTSTAIVVAADFPESASLPSHLEMQRQFAALLRRAP